MQRAGRAARMYVYGSHASTTGGPPAFARAPLARQPAHPLNPEPLYPEPFTPQAVKEGFSYVGFMANTICYGMEESPAKASVPSLTNCKPCVGPFSENQCGSGTGMAIYDVDAVAFFAPPPPDLDGAPPDARR